MFLSKTRKEKSEEEYKQSSAFVSQSNKKGKNNTIWSYNHPAFQSIKAKKLWMSVKNMY